MTAPVNALVSGDGLRSVPPGRELPGRVQRARERRLSALSR